MIAMNARPDAEEAPAARRLQRKNGMATRTMIMFTSGNDSLE